ncbi:MAG: PAS domain S-box protein [Bacteroidales bacterium]|nr:PAS domain S-box protein [Bacteroidota bacterium]MBL6949279.1 PAS domain S-box protein [Bacteroidales bacterium]
MKKKANRVETTEVGKRKQAEEKYRDLFDNSSDFLFTMDLKGNFTNVNKAAEINTGYTRNEIIGMSFKDYTERKNHPDLVTAFSTVYRTGAQLKDYAFDVIIKDKKKKHFEINLSLLKKDDKIIGFKGSARDVTLRKQAIEALHQSEEKFRAISTSAQDAIIMINNDGLITFWNPSAEEMFQYTKKEVQGKDLHALLTQEIYHEAFQEGFRKFKSTGKGTAIDQTLELTAKRKDGTEFPIALSLSAVKLEGKWNAIGIVRDITLQKQLEITLRDQSDELKGRNEELDAYAQTVAHDLKNPLGLVIGYSDLIITDYDELSENETKTYIGEINDAGKKMQNIIDNLLLFASLRKEEIKPNVLDMGDIVGETIKRLKPMIKEKNATITIPDKWPRVVGYAAWVEEIWINYLSNALKYGGESPRIELGSDTGKSKNILEGFARFRVRDFGSGIDLKEKKHLFKSFERFDAGTAKGHGLGLSIVKRIVEKLGGEVDVISEAGKGSTFYFTLPT